jgi:hypothetical protein
MLCWQVSYQQGLYHAGRWGAVNVYDSAISKIFDDASVALRVASISSPRNVIQFSRQRLDNSTKEMCVTACAYLALNFSHSTL